MASSERPETHYTVFIKVPFPRGEFVDPAAVSYRVSKTKSTCDLDSIGAVGLLKRSFSMEDAVFHVERDRD